MDMVDTVASIPAIIGLINLMKKLGLSARVAPAVAVLLGVGLMVATEYYAGTPWFDSGSTGLLMGLAAMGLFDMTHTPKPRSMGRHKADA